jgi:hypothetical protein
MERPRFGSEGKWERNDQGNGGYYSVDTNKRMGVRGVYRKLFRFSQ